MNTKPKTVGVAVDDDIVRGALCSAFEGGSNYWIRDIDIAIAHVTGIKAADFGEGGGLQLPGTYWHWSQLAPLVVGCAVIVRDVDGKKHRLNRAAIDKGLAVMAQKYGRHFGDLISESGDASTGDVFLQCCLFGEVIYG